jgi:hypothetical protein
VAGKDVGAQDVDDAIDVCLAGGDVKGQEEAASVAAGLAVALLPAVAHAAAPNPHVTIAPVHGNPARQISLAHRKEVTAVPAVKTVVHTLTTGYDWHQPASQAGSA